MANRSQRGVAMLVALMVVLGLVLLGSMIILTIDNVEQRSGTFRRYQSGHPCAEEGLNLGRAWLLQVMGAGSSLPAVYLTGTAPGSNSTPGNGLLADPTDPNDLANANKDLCQIAPGANLPGGGPAAHGLQGLCRVDPNATCTAGAGKCAAYRINLVDDLDEIAPAPINPWVDTNHTFIIRSECLETGQMSPTTGAAVGTAPQVEVATVEINQAGAGCAGYGNSLQAANSAGCGGGSQSN